MAFARSHIVSENYMYGQGFPPNKLRRSHMRKILNSGSWMQVCDAVTTLRGIHWKADLKLIFDARIGTLGKR